jgi:hypothetical protein
MVMLAQCAHWVSMPFRWMFEPLIQEKQRFDSDRIAYIRRLLQNREPQDAEWIHGGLSKNWQLRVSRWALESLLRKLCSDHVLVRCTMRYGSADGNTEIYTYRLAATESSEEAHGVPSYAA